MKLSFTRAGGYLHARTARRGDEHTINYNLADFELEFRDLGAGADRYRIDARLARFIEHFFGGRNR